MRASPGGGPEIGPAARSLGVRPGVDFPQTTDAAPVQSGDGGLSVAPDDPRNLVRARRPAAFGGTGKDPVWYIEEDDLGPDLVARPDSPTHALVEPARPMTVAEFQQAVAATADRWRSADPGGV